MTPSHADDRQPGERRSSYRFPVEPSRQKGELRVGRKRVTVEILDESAGGFGVLTDGKTAIEIGRILLLKTVSGSAEVQVMDLSLQEGKHEGKDNSAANTKMRVGLKRLRDLHRREVEPFWRRPIMLPWRALTRVLAAIPAFLIIAGVLAAAVLWDLQHPFMFRSRSSRDRSRSVSPYKAPPATANAHAARSSGRPDREAASVPAPAHRNPPEAKSPSPLLDALWYDSAGAATSSRREPNPFTVDMPEQSDIGAESPLPESTSLESQPDERLSDEVLRRSRPKILLEPRIAAALGLSQAQRDQLERLSEDPANLEVDLARRSLAILSQKQRRQWIRLLSEE